MKKVAVFILLVLLRPPTSVSQSWDEFIYMGKEQHAEGNLEKAIVFLTKGADLKQNDNGEWYLYAGILAARLKEVEKSFELLNKAIEAGMWDFPRLERNQRLDVLREDSRWDDLRAKIEQEEQRYLDQVELTHPQIRQPLKDMWRHDQDLAGKWEQQKEVIDQNTALLDSIITEHGWPTIPMVGKDCSWMAWAVAQHSFNIDFQRKSLMLMKVALDDGEIAPTQYAELHDRISRNTKEKQLYGMATLSENGKKVFYPIENEANVDSRRAAIGLPPLKVFANVNYIDY